MITTLLYSLFALDQTLAQLAAEHSWLLFSVLFLVIFAETGLVVLPLLPGDSLLFLSGTVAAASGMNVHLLALTMFIAAVLGDSLNYAIGNAIGPRAFRLPPSSRLRRFLKPEYLARTTQFYDRYGGLTIVIGRFVPIVRSFAPFLAGVAQMRYPVFLAYNVAGGALWVGLLVYSGYLFGNIPWVKENLSLLVVGIVVVTLAPTAVQFIRERRSRRAG